MGIQHDFIHTGTEPYRQNEAYDIEKPVPDRSHIAAPQQRDNPRHHHDSQKEAEHDNKVLTGQCPPRLQCAVRRQQLCFHIVVYLIDNLNQLLQI